MSRSDSAGSGSAALRRVTTVDTSRRWPSPVAPVGRMLRHRALIGQLVRKEIVARYRGSVLGLLWSLATPLLLLSVYTFVFGVVLDARWPRKIAASGDSRTEFALLLFTGLSVFWLFSECIGRAPSLVVAHAGYVRKLVFPLEVLPYVVLGSALFHLGISLLLLIAARTVILGGLPPVTSLLLPVALLPLVCLVLALSWGLAALGAFFRDIGHLVAIAVQAMLFLSPIFYPTSALPESAQLFTHFNPLAVAVEQVRGVLLWGSLPEWRLWLGHMAFSCAAAWLGLFCFERSRGALADVV